MTEVLSSRVVFCGRSALNHIATAHMCSWSSLFLAGAGVSDFCALQWTGKTPTVVSSWIFRRTVSPELEVFDACVTASFLNDQHLWGVWLSTFLTPVTWEHNKRHQKTKKNRFKRLFCAVLFNDSRLGIDDFTCKHNCVTSAAHCSV